jgi:DNA repair photolyase
MQAIYEPRGAAREYAPLACNLYRGCVHGCRYCYSPATLRMSREEFHGSSRPRPGILEALEKDARRLVSSRPVGMPYVLLCFTSDPYPPSASGFVAPKQDDWLRGTSPPAPNDSSTTRRALEILAAHDVPVEVLTKAGTRAARDFDLLATMRAAFATTLLFTDDRDRAEWEPNAAPVEDRIEAIREAHRRSIPTWVSVEPIIDPKQALALIETLSDIVDEWRIGKLNHHPLAATIDWAAWAPRLLDAAQASGRRYMIKDALAGYLPRERLGERFGGPEAACRDPSQAPAAARHFDARG